MKDQQILKVSFDNRAGVKGSSGMEEQGKSWFSLEQGLEVEGDGAGRSKDPSILNTVEPILYISP